MSRYTSEDKRKLSELCEIVKTLISQNNYQQCKKLISGAMEKYPHAPEPHNLFGILLEKEDDHLAAMKHFRAAWALDPTYIPARHNLNRLASFYVGGKCAFDETDIIDKHSLLTEIAELALTDDMSIKITQVPISGTAPAVNKKLWEINLPQQVVIAFILRNDKAIIARGDTQILAGDVLILVSSEQYEEVALRKLILC